MSHTEFTRKGRVHTLTLSGPASLRLCVFALRLSPPLAYARGTDACLLGLLNLHRIHMTCSVHVGTKHDPLHVRGKSDVGFQPVIMLGHVHQAFGSKNSGFNQPLLVRGQIWDHLWTKQVDPLPILGFRYHLRPAAIAHKQFSVW